MSYSYHRSTWFIILFAVSLLSGCKDDLPLYAPPKDIFTVYLSSYDSTSVVFYSATAKKPPVVLYSIFTHDSKFRIHVQNPNNPNVDHGTPISRNFIFGVENIYEETIQASPAIKGTFEIWPDGSPNSKYSLPLDNNILNQSPLYSNGLITIDPHEKLYFMFPWNFILNSNTSYIHHFALPANESDRGEYWRSITYQPLTINVRVTIQLFNQGAIYVSEEKVPISLYGIFYLSQSQTP